MTDMTAIEAYDRLADLIKEEVHNLDGLGETMGSLMVPIGKALRADTPTDTARAGALGWVEGQIHNTKLDAIEDRYGIKGDPDGVWSQHLIKLKTIHKALTRPKIDLRDVLDNLNAILCNPDGSDTDRDIINQALDDIKKLMGGE